MKPIRTDCLYHGNVAGVQFHAYHQRAIELPARELFVVPEPTNLHDARAIAVHARAENGVTEKVGFIPRSCTEPLHRAIREGYELKARCDKVRASLTRLVPQIEVWGEKPVPPPPPNNLRPSSAPRRLILS